jgi:hypothetical protein
MVANAVYAVCGDLPHQLAPSMLEEIDYHGDTSASAQVLTSVAFLGVQIWPVSKRRVQRHAIATPAGDGLVESGTDVHLV